MSVSNIFLIKSSWKSIKEKKYAILMNFQINNKFIFINVCDRYILIYTVLFIYILNNLFIEEFEIL